jgi:uncharacterized membrane protein
MRLSRPALYTLLLGLVGAAIVHIAVLLLVPAYSGRDAWSRIASEGEVFQFVRISGGRAGDPIAKGGNPFVRAIACRIEIDPAIAHVRVAGDLSLWTAAVFDGKGQNVFSLNDRTNVGNRLDLVIATPVAMVELRKDLPETYAETVFVELDSGRGLVVVRAIVPDASWSALADSFLDGAVCEAVSGQ